MDGIWVLWVMVLMDVGQGFELFFISSIAPQPPNPPGFWQERRMDGYIGHLYHYELIEEGYHHQSGSQVSQAGSQLGRALSVYHHYYTT